MDDSAQPASATPAAAPAAPPPVVQRDLLGRTVLGGALLAVGGSLVAALGSGWGLWSFGPALRVVFFAGIACGLILILAIGGWGWAQRKQRPVAWRRLGPGMLIAAAFLLYFLRFVWLGTTLPAIHDISSDPADPPAFVAIAPRADSETAVPGADDPAMQGLSSRQRLARMQAGAYGDIRSVRLETTPQQAFDRAAALVESRGWEMVASDPAAGRIEATDTSTFFRFRDDVVIRVRPAESGNASIVDMRSVSRVGQHDFGVNANRVRAFLADLSDTSGNR
jgi:uncharacterized protein (DUF1499 family)